MPDPQPSPLPWTKGGNSIHAKIMADSGRTVASGIEPADADLILSTFARVSRLEEVVKDAKKALEQVDHHFANGHPKEAQAEAYRLWWRIDTALADGKDSPQ